MKTYIALLRGINVSGHNIIKMNELKQLFSSLGFKNSTSYIQSGNVVFQSELVDISAIKQLIIDAINRKFSYSIKILVLTKNQLSTIFKANPFLERENIDIKKLHVTILDKQPDIEGIVYIEGLTASSDDKFKIVDKSVYVYCPNGQARTKLTNNLFEKKLKTDATSRNWKTISKLIELSNQ